MSNKPGNRVLRTLLGARAAGRDFVSAARGNLRNRGAQKKLTDKLAFKLPVHLMGSENYDTAYRAIQKHVRSGNVSSARSYVRDQLKKIAVQKKEIHKSK